MKIVDVRDAVGLTLCHDITKIVPGEFKGRAFKKGHVIEEKDIQELLSIGKDHIYIFENSENLVHEEDAALFLTELTAGEGTTFNEVKEGKIEIFADRDGLLKIDVETLIDINSIEEIVISTIKDNTVVKKGDKIAAAKVIPLTIKKEKLEEVEKLVNEKLMKVVPIEGKTIGIVTTGSEVFYGRIKDASRSAIEKKLNRYNCKIVEQKILPDDLDQIKEAINYFIDKDVDVILCTGGMSVDADDLTPVAIKDIGSEIVSYGTPIFPGAMFLVSYKEDKPILGLPGGVIFSKTTTFDVLLPRILAGEKLTKRDIAKYSHGGLNVVKDYEF